MVHLGLWGTVTIMGVINKLTTGQLGGGHFVGI